MTSAVGSLWRPVSPCGAGCLPRQGTTTRALGVVRLLALAGTLVALVALSPVLLSRAPRLRAPFAWLGARGILAALGVRTVVSGRVPGSRGRQPGVLLVANHISWLDVLALLTVAPGAVMLAKREVRGWPVLGPVAGAAGTIFVDRSRPRALPGTVAGVARALRSGAAVAVFPEGTTWCGSAAGRFRPAVFQAALDAGAGVLPVSLSYRAGGASTTAAAFLGDESLWASVRRVATTRRLAVRVDVAAELHPPATGHIDRRALARMAEAAVQPAGALVLGRAPNRKPVAAPPDLLQPEPRDACASVSPGAERTATLH